MTTDIELPFRYPQNAKLVPVTDIVIEGRSREDFGNLRELADSILDVGLIHPPTVDLNFVLLGGERRLRAMRDELKVTHIPVSIFEECSDEEVLKIEWEENAKRKKMSWQEEVMLISRHHYALMRRHEKVKEAKGIPKAASLWGQTQTARTMEIAVASVNYAIKLANAILAGDAEIIAAESPKKAYEILLMRKKGEALRQSLAVEGTTPTRQLVKSDMPSASDIVVVDLDGLLNESDTVAPKPKLAEPVKIDLKAHIKKGDFRTVAKSIPDEYFDAIVTDIPYGIDMDQVTHKNLKLTKKEHDVAENLDLMLPFLTEAYRTLKNNAYCVFWFDLVHFEKLLELAKSVGFKPQKWPIIWNKTHKCSNKAGKQNFTKNIETCMILKKGSPMLEMPMSECVWTGTWDNFERAAFDHPFAKPFGAWKFVMEATVPMKGKIWDMFGGQGSIMRPAILMGYRPFMTELLQEHVEVACLNTINAYKELLGEENVTFVNVPKAVKAQAEFEYK